MQDAISNYDDLITEVKRRNIATVISQEPLTWSRQFCKDGKSNKKERKKNKEAGRQNKGLDRTGIW